MNDLRPFELFPMADTKNQTKALNIHSIVAGYRRRNGVHEVHGLEFRNAAGQAITLADAEGLMPEAATEYYDRIARIIANSIAPTAMEGMVEVSAASWSGTETVTRDMKTAVLEALRLAFFSSATVEYSGADDSGCVDSVVLRRGEYPEENDTLQELVADYAWACIEAAHPGWEINSGGGGEVEIDVASGKVTLKHNHFFEDSTYVETAL